MNTKIDIKSALVGLGAGVLVAVGAAAASSSGSSVGRYQLVSVTQNGGGGGSQSLIIDTLSGKVWSAYLPPNNRTDDDFFQPKNGEK
jgi:hypothetical protein